MAPLLTVAFPELAPGDQAFLSAFRKANSPDAAVRINLHFTLVFACSQVLDSDYTTHVAAVAERSGPIKFNCRYAMLGADDEDDRAYVFLVPDEGYSAIALLHDRLYSGPLAPHLRLDLPYVPHITIGILRDRSRAKALCDDLNRKAVEVTGSIGALTVGTISDGVFLPRSEHAVDA